MIVLSKKRLYTYIPYFLLDKLPHPYLGHQRPPAGVLIQLSTIKHISPMLPTSFYSAAFLFLFIFHVCFLNFEKRGSDVQIIVMADSADLHLSTLRLEDDDVSSLHSLPTPLTPATLVSDQELEDER